MDQSLSKENSFQKLCSFLDSENIQNWSDISLALDKSIKNSSAIEPFNHQDFRQKIEKGIAFITFDYGIDGVSIEISKYALCLETLFKDSYSTVPLHFIAGDFHKKADTVLKSHWHRFKIPNINGWSKWDNGKWFNKLFYEKMPENSDISDKMAQEIWRQAKEFSQQLGNYLIKNDISLLIPVNICTNPGNPALTLAVILVTEWLGVYVISSNHDFYWEGGKAERDKNEEKGPRDHFFKNYRNRPFFSLFTRILPWNGKRWIQVNINKPQSEKLIRDFGFSSDKVFEIGSCISTEFFKEYDWNTINYARLRMSYILSNGKRFIEPVAIDTHLKNLNCWMTNQTPILCGGYSNKTSIDIANEDTIFFLQPTRIIGRKRIYKDLKLISSLLKDEKFKKFILDKPERKIVLLITGPPPKEHQKDLENVLQAYKQLINEHPLNISEKVFIAFSVGTEYHSVFKEKNMEKLNIEDIYRMANIVLFPSETEGRGLPIIESSACGVPIVCSRYYPLRVFEEVIGTNLSPEESIKYISFPEYDNYPKGILTEISQILCDKNYKNKYSKHNRKAVKKRYGIEMLVKKFDSFINILYELE